jgi:hypothetical protein
MIDSQKWYIESGSTGVAGIAKEQTAFPYFDNYNVVTGSFPTTDSKSLLFFNEQASYGEVPTETLYSDYWETYVELLYNPRTRLLNASAIIPLADYFKMELNDIVSFRGNFYHLRFINDYNLKNGECSIQLLGPILSDASPAAQSCDFNGVTIICESPPVTTTTSTSTTTTEAPTTTTTTTICVPCLSYTLRCVQPNGCFGGTYVNCNGAQVGVPATPYNQNRTICAISYNCSATDGYTCIGGAPGNCGSFPAGCTTTTTSAPTTTTTSTTTTTVAPTTTTTTTAIPPETPYQVGQYRDGGYVFYVEGSAPTQTGLIVAPINSAQNVPWGCQGTFISGSNGRAIGTGQSNTTAILANCATRPIAASVADAYTNDGYSDWYLPSRVELETVVKQFLSGSTVGSFSSALNRYFTSTQASGSYAFVTGNPSTQCDVIIIQPGQPAPNEYFFFNQDKNYAGGGGSDATFVKPIRSFAATTTTTAIPLTLYTGCGRGNTIGNTCSDAANNRTFYSDCGPFDFGIGCTVYTDTSYTTLIGYEYVFINGATWDINNSTGVITALSSTQC